MSIFGAKPETRLRLRIGVNYYAENRKSKPIGIVTNQPRWEIKMLHRLPSVIRNTEIVMLNFGNFWTQIISLKVSWKSYLAKSSAIRSWSSGYQKLYDHFVIFLT